MGVIYYPNQFSKYWNKIKLEEENKLINSIVRQLNVKVVNNTNQDIQNQSVLGALKGLVMAKGKGLNLPKNIIFKKIETSGHFCIIKPRNIYLNPELNPIEIANTSIHETTHKNDILGMLTRIPVLSFITGTPGYIITKLNRTNITKSLGDYACTDREEFLACTAEKLIGENKTWSDLDPKIQKLYKFFRGPKLKLKGD